MVNSCGPECHLRRKTGSELQMRVIIKMDLEGLGVRGRLGYVFDHMTRSQNEFRISVVVVGVRVCPERLWQGENG